MIQRIQTIYLLLVVVLLTTVFFLMPTGVLALNIVAAIISFVALVTIFLFKKRKVQINLSLLNFGFVAVYFALFFYNLSQSVITLNDLKQILLLALPVIGLFFNLLAMLAIKKDEALIKSLNRLR